MRDAAFDHLPAVSEPLQARARKISLLLMDVDGVMTDGKIYFLPEGGEAKGFNAQDGVGIRLLQRAGVRTGILSGRESSIVSRRAAELGMSIVLQKSSDKLASFHQILQQEGLTADRIGFVGDDLVDLPVFQRVGLAVAVANAREEVRRAAHYVTQAPGGQGAVREVTELILRAQDKWGEVTERYLRT